MITTSIIRLQLKVDIMDVVVTIVMNRILGEKIVMGLRLTW